ncbi:hypothetical protein I552_6410 [Mycobacterium xenopi 3993]|nr:hypothetical protein I552_6410 [Mycobacterium xenopi 3993]
MVLGCHTTMPCRVQSSRARLRVCVNSRRSPAGGFVDLT